jgi:hypothetical protein
MRVPSGDHDGVGKSSLSEPASVLDPLPSALTTRSRVSPRYVDANAIRVPSGDHAIAAISSSARRVSWVSPLPPGSAPKICARSPSPGADGTPMNAIRSPSGDHAGANATATPPMTRPPVPSAATTRIWNPGPWAVDSRPPNTATAPSVPATNHQARGRPEGTLAVCQRLVLSQPD